MPSTAPSSAGARAGYEAVIGLEVHAQLLTRSKLFCSCANRFGAPPNTLVCPVCLGLPGALPVPSRHAVTLALRAALALGCRVNEVSVFERKNYFYPDLPKGYQISQYQRPLAEDGSLEVTADDGAPRAIRIQRVHMEEDAGKLLHEGFPWSDDSSGVDLNRAGVPLIEIVSEPDLRSPEEAHDYLVALRAVLLYAEVSDGNMEEGSLRCDANVSVRRRGEQGLATRTEIKNLNSFRHVARALGHEIARQVALVESGGNVEQETRLFDPDRGETRSMRSKEEAHDYRYFPEPDLPPVRVPPELVERLRGSLPELPRARSQRYQKDLGLSPYDAGVLVSDAQVAGWFDRALTAYGGGPEAAKKVANWVNGEVARLANESATGPAGWKLTPEKLAAVLRLIDAGTIGGPGAKQVVEEVFRTGADPAAVVQEKGLAQVSDEGAIEAVVDKVLARSPAEVERHRTGKKDLTGFFVGQVMKELRGKGNPAVVNALLKKKLGGS